MEPQLPHDDPMRHCYACGSPLELRQVKPGDPARPVCTACGKVIYLDPKVAAAAIFTLDDRILLLRRGIEPGYGRWVMPGGFVDRGEEVSHAAIRETREEVGLEIALDGLLGVYSYSGWASVVVVYRGRVLSGTPRADDETLEVATFSPDEIPWDGIAFYTTHDALRDYLALFYPTARPPLPSPSRSNPRRGPHLGNPRPGSDPLPGPVC